MSLKEELLKQTSNILGCNYGTLCDYAEEVTEDNIREIFSEMTEQIIDTIREYTEEEELDGAEKTFPNF